jgi:hypothetical protein
MIHSTNESYAVGDGRIVADFGDLFGGSFGLVTTPKAVS